MEKENPLKGHTVAVTGKLEHFTRDEVMKKIASLGGAPRSGVSRNTDYLVCGTGSGSKLEKAQSFGVRVITEQEFLNMIA